MPTDQKGHLLPKRPSASFWADPNPVKVALWFKASDAPRLWDLASRHYPEDENDDAHWFAKAARCAERGIPAVLECGVREQVEEAIAFFIRWGIEAPRSEELRI